MNFLSFWQNAKPLYIVTKNLSYPHIRLSQNVNMYQFLNFFCSLITHKITIFCPHSVFNVILSYLPRFHQTLAIQTKKHTKRSAVLLPQTFLKYWNNYEKSLVHHCKFCFLVENMKSVRLKRNLNLISCLCG